MLSNRDWKTIDFRGTREGYAEPCTGCGKCDCSPCSRHVAGGDAACSCVECEVDSVCAPAIACVGLEYGFELRVNPNITLCPTCGFGQGLSDAQADALGDVTLPGPNR